MSRSAQSVRRQIRALGVTAKSPHGLFEDGFLSGARFALSWILHDDASPPHLIARDLMRVAAARSAPSKRKAK